MNNGQICVSVCAETADEMIANIRRAEEFADVVEVRFDCLDRDEISNFKFQISNLRFEKPLLATFRSAEQGGRSDASLSERGEFWASIGSDIWAVDLEVDVFGSQPDSVVGLVSHHDFNGVPDDLDAIYSRIAASDADVVKIAVTADDIVDTIPVWKLIEKTKSVGKDIIPIAMGDAGKWTRILGLAHCAFLTYASLDTGKETADGQITAKDLQDVFRVKELDAETRVFGVIGNPVSASLSPYMQNPAFAGAGENAVFMSLLVKDLDQFIRRMVRRETREVELNFGGLSVTMPHKQAIIEHLDAIDPVAETIGAVNTIKIDDGKLIGFNTDAHGFITPLKERFGDLNDARVAVYGAGGAARAVVYALKNEGADVSVFVRDRAMAAVFSEEMSVRVDKIRLSSVGSEKFEVDSFDIVVNATPLGMKGPLENESLFTAEELLGVRFVYDLVAKPTDTPLVAEAKKAGIPVIGGLEMLIEQGAMQFKIWTGREAPVELMRSSLLTRMNG